MCEGRWNAVMVGMVQCILKALPLQKRQWTSNKNIYKVNVNVGISGKKGMKQGRDEIKKAYGKLLITFLHCHSKLFDNIGMSDQ